MKKCVVCRSDFTNGILFTEVPVTYTDVGPVEWGVCQKCFQEMGDTKSWVVVVADRVDPKKPETWDVINRFLAPRPAVDALTGAPTMVMTVPKDKLGEIVGLFERPTRIN